MKNSFSSHDRYVKVLRKNFGFSLVEVIVASVLLAMITAGILSVALSARNIIKRSHLRHQGFQVAEAVVEKVRKYLGQDQWNNTLSPIYPSVLPKCSDLKVQESPDLGIYDAFCATEFAVRHQARWCYQVVDLSGSTGQPDCPGGGCDYRKITVNVTWQEDRPT